MLTIVPSKTSSNVKSTLSGVELQYSSNVTKSAKSMLRWVDVVPGQIPMAQPSPILGARPVRLDATNADVSDHIDGRFIIGSHHDVKEGIHAVLTQLTKERKVDRVVKLLNILDPRIKNILPLTENNENVIYFDVGYEEPMPLFLEGQGAFNMLNLSCNIASMEAGVILVDEIESGLHYSLYKPIIQFILSAIRNKPIQVFVTTHSDDFIEDIAEIASAENFKDFCAFRFNGGQGQDQVTRFDHDDILNARDIHLELR
jgi:hypothetical protein